jgi:hypothetical protein
MDLNNWENVPAELLDPARLWLHDNSDRLATQLRDRDEVADRGPLASDPTPPRSHPATVPEPLGPECPRLTFPVRDITRKGDLPGTLRERARDYQVASRADPTDWSQGKGADPWRTMRQPSAMTFHRLLAHFALAEPTVTDHAERNGLLHSILVPIPPDAMIPTPDGTGSPLELWGESGEFGLLGLERLLFLFARTTETLDNGRLVPMIDCDLQREAVRQMLGFKYFGDDLAVYPQDGHTEVYWSENHQIGYAVAEYLAGQLLPDGPFEPRARYGLGYWVTELPPGQAPRPVAVGAAVHPIRRLDGRERMDRAYPRIVRWLDHRLMFGFSEWNSPVYYEYDIAALLNLVDFCDQPHLVDKAAMALDLLFLDMARFSGQGQAGSTAGRAYTSHKLASWRASSCNTLQILFGNWDPDPRSDEVLDRWRLQNISEKAREEGRTPTQEDLQPFVPCRSPWLNADSVGAHSLATTDWYGLPDLLGTFSILPWSRPEVPRFERSRVSVGTEEGASVYGIGTTTDQEVLDWWSRAGFGLTELIAQTRDLATKWQVWNVSPFSEMPGLFVLPTPALLAAADALSAEGRGSFLGTANLALWREKGLSLSSAQKFNVATVGRQAQIWQATLGPYVSVFSTYPAAESSESDSDGPSWWAGNASQPRVVQHEDALICVHDSTLLSYTNAAYGHRSHAWFPVEMFDEAYQYHRDEEDDDFTFILDLKTGDHRRDPIGIQAARGGTWWFGRRADAYVGLFSAKDGTRLLRTGRWADREILCEDRVNVFICQVGSDDRFGTFDRFRQHCIGARIHIGMGVYQPSNPFVEIYAGYDIPDPTQPPGTSRGRLSLNTEDRFPSLHGRPISDESYPRWDTPWGKVRWGEVDYTLACTDLWGDGHIWLRHNTVSGLRTGSGLT